jgi:predicted O-methyltransferase YrrM
MKADKVLELGTATGYSAIWFAKALKATGGMLTSIEWDIDMMNKAQANIAEAGFSDCVELFHGDAKDLLSKFEENHFDIIFQDVGEDYYSLIIPHLRQLESF